MCVVESHCKYPETYAEEHGEEYVGKEMHPQVEPGQCYQERIHDGYKTHIGVHVEEHGSGRKGRQRMTRRERIIPGLLYQELIVLVEERSVPLGDVLDKEVTYHDGQQQRDKDAVADPGTLVIISAGDKEYQRREDPDKAEVTGTRDGDHSLVHKGRIKKIVEPV